MAGKMHGSMPRSLSPSTNGAYAARLDRGQNRFHGEVGTSIRNRQQQLSDRSANSKLARNRHVGDYYREVGLCLLMSTHLADKRPARRFECLTIHVSDMATIRPGGFRDPWAFVGTNLGALRKCCAKAYSHLRASRGSTRMARRAGI
jgi:hypothetical protein